MFFSPLDCWVDCTTKGMPGDLPSVQLSALGGMGWNVLRQTLPLPIAVLKQSALENNSRWMGALLRKFPVALCPHGKTTMSPQMFWKQLEDGCWGITVSTPHQFHVALKYGISRIIIANQILDPVFLSEIFLAKHTIPQLECFFLVDSVAGVRLIGEVGNQGRYDRPLTVLIEVGSEFGRTGCRSVDEVLSVANAVAEIPDAVQIVGVEGFEGAIRGSTLEEREERIAQFLDQMVAVATTLERIGHFRGDEVLLSAGGTGYVDLVMKRLTRHGLTSPTRVVIRSGCYVTHDARMYEDHFARGLFRSPEMASDLRPQAALELWTYVQSRPSPSLLFLTAGKRDCSYDVHYPDVLSYARQGSTAVLPLPERHEVTAMNDQHLYVRCPESSPLQPGDMVKIGISHPCTTFDKWDVLLVVDDQYNVVDAIKTFF